MNFKDAVSAAINRLTSRHNSAYFSRRQLLDEEYDAIRTATGTAGNTPTQTISRTLQDLRDEGLIEFTNNDGLYRYLVMPVIVEQKDHSKEVLDAAIWRNMLVFETVPTNEERHLARRRVGQERLRMLTLQNYSNRCAFCDITDDSLLVASHIVRWADGPHARGDLANLLCLCRFHDVLFENGLFALTDDLCVIKRQTSNCEMLRQQLLLTTQFLAMPKRRPSPIFLKCHRQRVGFDE